MIHMNNIRQGRQVQVTPAQINEVIATMPLETRNQIVHDFLSRMRNQSQVQAAAAAAAVANGSGRVGMNAVNVGGVNMGGLTQQQIQMLRANALMTANANNTGITGIQAQMASAMGAGPMMNTMNMNRITFL